MNAVGKTLAALLAFISIVAVLAGALLWFSPAIAAEVVSQTTLAPEVVQGVAESLPFRACTFDCVLSRRSAS